MTYLSERVLQIAEPQTIGMSRKSRELKAKGIDVISLSLGEPDFSTPDFIKEAAKKAIDEDYSHYTPVAGFLELRKAITEKLKRDNGLDYHPDQILVSTGAKQSLVNVILSLIDPGDEVIIPAPYWVSYYEQVKFAGGVPVVVHTTMDTGFKMTPEALRENLTDKTKMLLYSSPCNPSGAVYSDDELAGLARVLADHPNVFVISDEIYELINYGSGHASMASQQGMFDRTITVNGLSKGFAMTGYRLGYLAGPVELVRACDTLQGQFTSGTNAVTQIAAITAMEADPSRLNYMIEAFNKRRDLAISLLKEIDGLDTPTPDGAFYLFPNISKFLGLRYGETEMKSSTDICEYLLEVGHVATVPGDAFGIGDHIRLSYATSEDQIREAISRIKNALQNLRP